MRNRVFDGGGIRGDNYIVVAAPSMHKDGNRYTLTHSEFLDGLAELPELPQALIDAVDAKRGGSKHRKEDDPPFEFTNPTISEKDREALAKLAAMSSPDKDFENAAGGDEGKIYCQRSRMRMLSRSLRRADVDRETKAPRRLP